MLVLFRDHFATSPISGFRGAEKVNRAALLHMGVTEDQVRGGYPGDPKINGDPIVADVGLCIRLTRNLDKDRGFVNGAIGRIHHVLNPFTFLLKLSTGNMVLVHPVSNGGESPFLPCTYGYASTIRRAQGSSLAMGCSYFDHCYPPERGYGYVGAFRFRSADGLFLYGKVRRTDWLPVGEPMSMEQLHRGAESMSEDSDFDEQDRELELLYDNEDDEYDQELNDACRWGYGGDDLDSNEEVAAMSDDSEAGGWDDDREGSDSESIADGLDTAMESLSVCGDLSMGEESDAAMASQPVMDHDAYDGVDNAMYCALD